MADLRGRIEATGRSGDSVRIVAVTKTFGPAAVRAAAANGLTHVGENYVDELCTTRSSCGDVPVTWHYLGALQSNKIARVLECADLVASVSRAKEIDRIVLGPQRPLYIQVDVTDAPTRSGARPSDVPGLVQRARAAGLDVRGLMLVAPIDPSRARAAFRLTRSLADGLGLPECSMGMSDDLEAALEEGSTEIRVGRALFGPRAPKPVTPNMETGEAQGAP